MHCVIPENICTPHPLVGKGNSNGRGVQREAISEGVGACLLRFFFFSRGLIKISELSTTNSFSVEHAISYFNSRG